MSTDYSEQEVQLRQQMQRASGVLQQLQQELAETDQASAQLAEQKPRFDALSRACRALQELDDLDAGQLFWNGAGEQAAKQLTDARRRVEQFEQHCAAAAARRQALIDKIEAQDIDLEDLHYDLQNAIDQEERRKNNWVIEREPNKLAHRALVMPWSRGFEEDRRFRRSLAASVVVAVALGWIVSLITLPILERPEMSRVLPERVAKVVREHRPLPPPPPVEEPVLAEEPPPEPEPEPVPVQELPTEPVERATVAQAKQAEPKPQVKSRGLLAFRDSIASRATSRPTAQLGASARFSAADDVSTERTKRSMVTTSAPGSSGGIDLADLSRDVGGGGGGDAIDGVALSRVASSIGGNTGSERPLSGGASAGRTDEEIQIVFDRYKAALYRLYNRELRRDPTLRGQLVLRLTIEPDGSVSLCQLESTNMNAPALAQQIVDRVQKFDFGAKQDIVAMTIIYPIDFLPAA